MEEIDDIPGGVAFQPMGAEMFSGIVSTIALIPESLELKKSRFDSRPQNSISRSTRTISSLVGNSNEGLTSEYWL